MSLACTTSTPTSSSNGANNSRKALSRRSPPVRMLFSLRVGCCHQADRELQRLLGKDHGEQDPQSCGGWSRQKWIAHASLLPGTTIRAVSQALGVSRAQLSVHVHRKPGWRDGRQHRQRDDQRLACPDHGRAGRTPSYGYQRVWALLRRQSEANDCPSSTPSGYIASCAIMACCWKKPAVPLAQQAHKGVSPLTRAIDAGARMALSFAAIMAKNSGSRSPWTAVTGEALDWAASTGGYDSDTVQDVMLRAVERRFGDRCQPHRWNG